MQLASRQIHLDFHTSPLIPDVAAAFEPRAFADRLKRAHVSSVTVFAKCHHGHLYYRTAHPARHPTMPAGLDLLGEQIDALRSVGIRAPAYLSVQCDEYAADLHPQWVALNADGSRVGAKPFDRGPFQWQILDMSSPYQDFLAEQIEEVVSRFKPLDGVFLDMCWDQPSSSIWAQRGMRELGLHPSNDADRSRYARRVTHAYMERFCALIRRVNGQDVPVFFNSRPLALLVDEARWLSHVEIEALPSGGWGYAYFPINVRYVRTFGLPYTGMTGRFHKSWSDFGGLKPEAALMYECCQMLAHGARCSVGDQLHPNGQLDPASYDLIGKVYAHVAACEPYCENAAVETDVVVLHPATDAHPTPGNPQEGAMRCLQELGHQFDFLPVTGSATRWTRYRVVVVPEDVAVDANVRLQLDSYVASGGRVLLVGAASVLNGAPSLPDVGYSTEGELPFKTAYFRFAPHAAGKLAATDHVMYEQGVAIAPPADAEVLATVVEPYFQRSWQHFSGHAQTPPKGPTSFCGAFVSGAVGVIAFPIFGAYAKHASLAFRQLVKTCMDQLLPDPLLRVRGPSHLEVTVTRQSSRRVLHLLSYVPRRRAPDLDLVEEPAVARDVELSLAWTDPMPKSVALALCGEPVSHDLCDGRLVIRLPLVEGHVMVDVRHAESMGSITGKGVHV